MADIYLGIVEMIQKRSQQQAEPRSGYALLRPLYRSAEDSSGWIFIEQRERNFPNRGVVTWYEPPSELAKDSLWQFQVQESHTYKTDNSKHDQFYVSAAIPPVMAREVIDLRLDDKPFVLDDARREVVEEGIELQFVPSQQIYLWIDDGAITNPIHLIQYGNKWRASPEQVQKTFIRVFSIPQKKIVELRINDAKRSFLTPDAQTGAPTQQLDWSSDDVLLKRVLKWIQETDTEFSLSVDLTRKAVSRAAELVRGEQSETSEGALRKQQLQRALRLASDLEDIPDLRRALEEDLLNLPSVNQRIKEAIDEKRREVREEIHHELSEDTSRADALRAEKTSLELEIVQLEHQRAELASAHQRQVEEGTTALEAALAEQISEVMNRPTQALANISIFRAALNLAPSTNSSNSRAPRQSTVADASAGNYDPPMRFVGSEVQIKSISDQQELRLALDESFTGAGLEPRTAVTLHAAFLSGMMPVLSGVATYEAVKSYASCVAGGRLLWIPVYATTLEPNDLLGGFNASSQSFAPHPNGLLDLLLHARNTDELSVVVLDGFNRAPVDSYLSTLLSLYGDARLAERQRRTLPLVHPNSISSENFYAAAAQLTWMPNVLLAGIWSEGAATLPVPASFWDAAALITIEPSSLGSAAIDAANQEVNGSDEASELTFDTWRAWQDEGAQRTTDTHLNKLIELLKDMEAALGGHQWSSFIKFYAAMGEWTPNENDALHVAVACCLAPRAVALGYDKQLVKAIEDAHGTNSDFGRMMQTVRQLLS